MIRCIELIVAGVALTLYVPVLCVAALAIYLEDRGAVFFVQERLGLNKKPFRIWKLRTMRDGEVTRVGRLLRKTALDEFLQFIHVFGGTLAVVGPRPLTESDVVRMGWEGREHVLRWTVKPGVTGPTQVYGVGRTAEESWEIEKGYLARRGVWFDLKLMVLSVPVNLFGKERVRRWFR